MKLLNTNKYQEVQFIPDLSKRPNITLISLINKIHNLDIFSIHADTSNIQ